MPLNPRDFSEVVLARILWNGFRQVLDDLAGRFETLAGDLWSAFPNPLAMLNALVKFGTGVPGMVLTLPVSGLKRMFLDLAKQSGAGARLIRLDDVLRGYFDMQIRFIQVFTLTGQNDLVDLILQWAGMLAYRTFKKAKLLWMLSKARTEAQFIEVFIKSFKSRVGLVRMVAIAMLFFLVFAVFGVLWSTFSLGFMGSQLLPHLLPQDSKRVWSSKRHQHRVNL